MCKQKQELTSLDVMTYPQLYIPTIAVHSLLESSAREAEAESNPVLTYLNLETTSRPSKHPLEFNFLETFKN